MSHLKYYLDRLFEHKILENGLPDLTEHVRQEAFETDWDAINEDEKHVVLSIREFARQLGADFSTYEQGVMSLGFKNRTAVINFMDSIESLSVADEIDEYDVEVRGENLPAGRMEDFLPFEDVMFDGNYEFMVHVYLNPGIVTYPAEEIEIEGDFEDENGELMEVRRKIKVTNRGKRWIKMQCRKGFKWNSTMRTCQKIGGADLAQLRRSIRKTVRTKRSKGTAFKTRVLRKQRRAKRFRKAMGMK